jgi:hypothetical protein
MDNTGSVTAVLVIIFLSAPSIRAQDVVLPGSTVEGDILRGQGNSSREWPGTN